EGVNPKNGHKETRPPDASAPFSGLVFKIMADKHLGQLSFVRIYSGTIKSGSYAYNSAKDTRERVGRLMLMHANRREDIEVASAGERDFPEPKRRWWGVRARGIGGRASAR